MSFVLETVRRNLPASVKAPFRFLKLRPKAVNSISYLHYASPVTISIKIAAPATEEGRLWGDFHFGNSLAGEIHRRGYTVYLEFSDHWSRRSDYSIVLRGLGRYRPQGEKSLLWVVSHPELISDDEYKSFDFVAVAGRKLGERVRDNIRADVSYLPQCTDMGLFFKDRIQDLNLKEAFIFVGNTGSRKRPIVDAFHKAGKRVLVFGRGWTYPYRAKKSYIENHLLRKYYNQAGAVLNDHWDSMKEAGILSNRVYDVAACGGTVISDFLGDFDEGAEDLVVGGMRLRKRAFSVGDAIGHSFSNRADVILDLFGLPRVCSSYGTEATRACPQEG